MSGYTRMLLVRPDMVNNNKADTTPPNTQKEYYDTQVLREKLSPEGAMIKAILHLQKKAAKVLYDDTLKSGDKLAKYDQLMTRSGIFTKKVKSITPEVHTQEIQLPSARSTPYSITPYQSAMNSDISSDEEDDWADLPEDTSTDMLQQPEDVHHTTKTKIEKSTEKGMDEDIAARIPRTYQHSARQLYRLLAKRGKGALNWDRQGRLRVGEHIEEGSDIIELLADATRPRSRSKPPVGAELFAKMVKKINPKLKHIKNKKAFGQVGVTKKVGTPRRQKEKKVGTPRRQQEGSGRKVNKKPKILWRTRL